MQHEILAQQSDGELYTPNIAINVPAATAVPITPATFGPIACIRRKLVGSASAPTFCDTRAAIGTADTPAEPISGLILPSVSLHISLPRRTPPAVPNAKAIRPRQRSSRYPCSGMPLHWWCSYGSTKQDNYDIHQGVGSCLCQLLNNTALAEQVTKHQHTIPAERW